jgi:hypothetical protein
MKPAGYLCIYLAAWTTLTSAQSDSAQVLNTNYPLRKLTVEPALGVHPYPTSDLVIANLIQWNISKRVCIISHTSFSYNNAFQRISNHISNDYNYSLGQRVGIGTTRYSKRSSHTLSLAGGLKYDAFQETLDYPGLEKVTASVSALSPDFVLIYNLKRGRKKCYFSTRLLVPLYPYPIKTRDTWSIDGNLANVSLEFGIGVRWK